MKFKLLQANYTRWLAYCHIPTFCDSLPHYDTTLIFGRSLLRSIFKVNEMMQLFSSSQLSPQPIRKQLLDKFRAEKEKMPLEKRKLLLSQFPRF